MSIEVVHRRAVEDRGGPLAFEARSLDVPFEALCLGASALGGAAVLDSVAGRPRRWSLVAFDPVERVEDVRSIAALRSRMASLPVLPVAGPFSGGFVGALAYDLGIAGEGLALPAAPWPGPRVAGGLYTDHVLVDHERGRAELRLATVAGDPRPPLGERLERALAAFEAARGTEPPAPRPLGGLRREVPEAEHRRRIEALRERIRLGEVYQANLAHRLALELEGEPLALYLALRRANPAPYAGLLEFPGEGGRARALLSSSPELLLEFDGERARTRPIKGTAPRGAGPRADAAAARGLLASAKDRAELAMIVDLARNDLGRLALPGTVAVDRFPELESYAAVHHLVADVRAQIRPELDAFDLLESCFPAASISGAPKAAAMEAIAALEGEGRGFFTGGLGFVDTRGRACWSVLIRTLEWRARPELGARAGEVSLSVGGGITWDSDAAAEVEETHHKARALLEALGVAP